MAIAEMSTISSYFIMKSINGFIEMTIFVLSQMSCLIYGPLQFTDHQLKQRKSVSERGGCELRVMGSFEIVA